VSYVDMRLGRWNWSGVLGAVGAVALVAGCSMLPKPSGTESEASPGRDAGSAKSSGAATGSSSKAAIKLPPPDAPRNWADARLQAAKRMVAANPDMTYTGKPPEMLLAIPVMTIELNGDGTVRNIAVMRYPSQARETVTMAMAAIKRAAPFGDVSKLPKPWKFNETFLFDDQRKFKPMTLDQR
jgi:hypothetical protein